MNLYNVVLKNYKENFSKLDHRKFHFASRLYLWFRDVEAEKWLNELKEEYIGDGTEAKFMEKLIELKFELPTRTRPVLLAKRKKYFDSYPQLQHANIGLFRLLFVRTVYGRVFNSVFDSVWERENLSKMRDQLLADTEALKALSTYAINYLYVFDRVVRDNENELPLKAFYNIGVSRYNLKDKDDLRLLIYFFTHCIIGETKFYYRKIPDGKRSIYLKMLKFLEEVITSNYLLINLDNKFEFLVCCRICDYETSLQEKINSEAHASVSEEGFIVDRHNSGPRKNNATFIASEHRNVLYIMSKSEFKPMNLE